MSTQREIHEVQAQILRELLFRPTARFSELNVTDLTNDHFTFHIKRLIEIDLITKEKGAYSLTTKGKEFANRMDTDTATLERQAKTAIMIVCVREHDGQQEFLMQQRLKQPYFGFYGFVTGKIRWGDEVIDTALRELEEETGYTGGKTKLVGIEHKMDIHEGVIQEDKYFYVVRIDNPKGTLMKTFEGGANTWVTEEEFLALDKKFDDIVELLALVKANDFSFVEKRYEVREY